MSVIVRPMTTADASAAKQVLDRAFDAEARRITGRGRRPYFGDALLPHRMAADSAGCLGA